MARYRLNAVQLVRDTESVMQFIFSQIEKDVETFFTFLARSW